MNRNRIALLSMAALGVWACSPDEYPTEHRFAPPPEEIILPDGELFFYTPPTGVTVTSVSVPGEFNGWNPGAADAQMEQLPDGRWVVGIEGLENGLYEYKFHFNHDATGAGGDWAGNMCNDATWGHPDFDQKVDSALTSCTDGGNGLRRIGPAGHTFRYVVPDGVDVTVVTVAGSFQPGDGWNNQTDSLTNVWEYTVDLEPGTYRYKYQFNETNGWAGNMCDDPDNWGHPDFGNAIDPDNDNCDGENAIITITEAGPHTFRYILPDGVEQPSQVTVAGEFQAAPWTPGVDFFTETFERTYELATGTYEYKFIFDGTWAGSMCASDTWAEGGMVDANGSGECNGENAVLTLE